MLSRTLKFLYSLISGNGWKSRIARAISALTITHLIQQILHQFGVDIYDLADLTLFDFTLIFVSAWLLIELSFFPKIRTKTDKEDNEISPDDEFSNSILKFAEYLKRNNKFRALLDVRNGVSRLLHLLGQHTTRTKLGALSLHAAVSCRSELDKATICIDDLGWAVYAAGNRSKAERNIKKGIKLARENYANETINSTKLHLKLIEAKGHRHLSVICNNPDDRKYHLDESEKIIDDLLNNDEFRENYKKEILNNKAQITYAKAWFTLDGSHINEEETIPPTNSEQIRVAKQAIDLFEQAAQEFEYLDDHERTAKALRAAEPIYRKLGQETEAIETRARINEVLRSPES